MKIFIECFLSLIIKISFVSRIIRTELNIMYTLIIILEEVNVIVALAERITGYLVSKDIIEKEEIDVYKYGYEILTSSLLGVLLILVVSILLHQVDVAIFFLCV